MGNCAYMLEDGDCLVAPEKPSSNGGGGGNGFVRRPEGDITITAPVGLSSPNKHDDVYSIQYGLDQVPPIDGGPSPQLKIDGQCGPKTNKAIQDFQKKHFGWKGCDGRIEPGKQTIKKINELRQRWIVPHLPLDLKEDDWLLAGMLQHIPHTKACIHAAMAKINSSMLSGSGGLPGLASSADSLLNKHFRIDDFGQARNTELQKVYDNYRFMLSVLDRPDAYITLDTDDSGEGISTVAFARLGGFFQKNDLSGKIRFRRGAYFATGIQDFAAFVFIHELKHFVEKEARNGHFGKGWVTDQTIQKLTPQERVGNCDTFAGFALEARNGEMQRPGWVKSTVFR